MPIFRYNDDEPRMYGGFQIRRVNPDTEEVEVGGPAQKGDEIEAAEAPDHRWVKAKKETTAADKAEQSEKKG